MVLQEQNAQVSEGKRSNFQKFHPPLNNLKNATKALNPDCGNQHLITVPPPHFFGVTLKNPPPPHCVRRSILSSNNTIRTGVFDGHTVRVRCARQYCETVVTHPLAQDTQPIQSTPPPLYKLRQSPKFIRSHCSLDTGVACAQHIQLPTPGTQIQKENIAW